MNRLIWTLAAAFLLTLPIAGAAAEPAAKAATAGKKTKKKKFKRQRWPTKRPNGVRAAPELGPIPFPQGERLAFKVKMLGADAGEVVLAVGERTTHAGRSVVPLAGHVRASEWLAKFYPVKDKLVVLVDEKTMVPLKSDFYIREAGKVIDYHTLFDHKKKLILSRREKSGKTLNRNFSTAGVVYDAMSSVYAARRIDLKPGLKFQYFVWDGRRERLVDIHVVGDEKVWTPMGWFDSTRVEITSRVTGGFVKPKYLKEQETKRGTVWYAKDAHRTPLKVVTPTKLGQAEGLLYKRFIDRKPVSGRG